MLKLYMAPGACSRVTLIALETAELAYQPVLVRFARSEHKSAEYLSLNPKGKIPTLIVDGVPLTENVAILTYLAQSRPTAGLLPLRGDLLDDARILSDLSWCASGLHPIVTRLRIPQFFCDDRTMHERVWRLAAEAIKPNFAIIEERLRQAPWWYGSWSLLDAYLFWVWFRVTGTGFDTDAYPHYNAHAARISELPAVKRALAVEDRMVQILASEGLALNFAPHPWTQ